MEGFQHLPDLFRNANHPPPANHSLSDSSTASQTQINHPPPANHSLPDSSTASKTQMPLVVDSNRKDCPEELKTSIVNLEKRLQSKSIDLTGQNSTRHQAVLRFLYYQRS